MINVTFMVDSNVFLYGQAGQSKLTKTKLFIRLPTCRAWFVFMLFVSSMYITSLWPDRPYKKKRRKSEDHLSTI